MRSRKLLRGSFLNTVDLVVQLAAGFYLMPLMIHAFGDVAFGVWILAMPFMGFAAGFDLGLYSAVSRFISQAIGKGGGEERSEIQSIAATGFYSFLFLALLSTAVIVAVFCGAPLFLRENAQIDLFRRLLVVLCVHNGFTYSMAVFEDVLAAHLRYDLIHGVRILFAAVRVVLATLLIRNHYGLIAVAWVIAGCSIAESLTQTAFSRLIDPRVSIAPRHFRWGKAKQLFSYGFYTFLGRIADLLRFQIDSFVIALFSGISLVTSFKIAARLNEYFIQFIRGITGGFNQYFSQEEGKNNFKEIIAKFLFITKITAYIAAFIGVMLILFGKDFIERWIGPGHGASYSVLLILTTPITLALIQAAIFPLLYGISKHKMVAFINIGEGSLNLVLSILLAPTMGILGVALGTAIPMLINKLFILPVYVSRVLQIPLGTYIRAVLTPFLKTLVVLLIPWSVMGRYLAPTYESLGVIGAIETLIFILFLFFLGFDRREKEYMAGILKNKEIKGALPCV